MLKLRTLFLLSVFSLNLFALDVIVPKSNLAYKEKIKLEDLTLIKVNKVKKNCIPVTVKMLQKDEYITKHYIKRGSIICTKDIAKYEKQSVLFDFGTIEIEKNGKVIYENKDYIKIKKENGRVEKIYKDGRL